VRSNSALKARLPGTEFLDAETGRQKSSRKSVNACRDQSPRSKWPEMPAETPYLTSCRKRAVCGDWMVETKGTELPTPHPVIELVSDNRVRNGIFRCRDGGAKTAFSSCGDRYRDERRLEKPTFRGTNARVSGRVRYLWTGWWAHQRSNLGPADRFVPKVVIREARSKSLTHRPAAFSLAFQGVGESCITPAFALATTQHIGAQPTSCTWLMTDEATSYTMTSRGVETT
jgi:hypothetical protein